MGVQDTVMKTIYHNEDKIHTMITDEDKIHTMITDEDKIHTMIKSDLIVQYAPQ
jgi:hypothetical protein